MAATTSPPPPLLPSALTTHISASSPTPESLPPSLSSPTTAPPDISSLLSLLSHTLTHAHNWTNLTLHRPLPKYPTHRPRPYLSGLPPKRVYVHPDQQVDELKRGVKDEDVGVEREWVVPVWRGERWTLGGLAGVVDSVPGEEYDSVPDEGEEGDEDAVAGGDAVADENEREEGQGRRGGERAGEVGEKGEGEKEGRISGGKGERKGGRNSKRTKRILLAVVGEDSTVVFYVLHDGIVKPRQN